ncbi:sugar kinase [Neobacillus sp. YIM B02564]|uniref:Sugar kinase n=1 Tax=Neobacillus paridis TaxID=2803862 RepID=A0ABS1TTU6_9BACI|nr:sugar kinase [Neobacillus paridis]MBL4954729.1 sugar kinase [Neobacillus paridis]
MLDVITIGDGMITMNPMSKGPLRFSNTFERKVGGAELNFAIGCSRLGLKAGWISKLGNDEFGRHILCYARGEGIDTSKVDLVDGYPTSIYFREILADGSSRSFYYRDNSPTLTMSEADLSEDYFKQAKLLHISGVFPSINANNKKIILEAVKLAKKTGLLISFDPNIRLKMWSKEEARDYIEQLLPDVDILLTGDEEAEIILGPNSLETYFQKFHEFGISKIAIKQGAAGSVGFDGKQIYTAPSIKARAVVDTVGAGDGFDAGFITSILKGIPFEKALHIANAVGAMVVSVYGDNEGLPYAEDVQAFLGVTETIER